VLLMTDIAEIPRDVVVQEYTRDRMERRGVVYATMGRNSVATRFLAWPKNKFMEDGYAGEKDLLGAQQ